MIVDDIWKNITDMVFDDVRTGVDDLKVAVYPNVGRKSKYVLTIGSKIGQKLRFSFLLCCLCLRLHQKILLFAENQLSSWEALTSFSLKIQIVEDLVYIAPQMLRRLDSSGRNLKNDGSSSC